MSYSKEELEKMGLEPPKEEKETWVSSEDTPEEMHARVEEYLERAKGMHVEVRRLVETYPQKAMRLVRSHIITRLEKTDPTPEFDVFVVWFCKVLQNWKALVSTTLPDGMYYEVTYNGDKFEAYIDAYKKFENVVVKDVMGPGTEWDIDANLPTGHPGIKDLGNGR